MTVLHHGLYNFTVFFLLDIFVYIFYYESPHTTSVVVKLEM